VSEAVENRVSGGRRERNAGSTACFDFSFFLRRYSTAGFSVGGKIPDFSKPLMMWAAVKPSLKIS
jgi:hypothetical protein